MTKKMNFLLDIDQTLISAEATEEYNFKKNGEKAKKFNFFDMEGYYIVFERPGLQEFLTFLFSNFNVSIWTAATKDYALSIIDNIILKNHPERKLEWIFFSYHCDLAKYKKNGSKDLSILWDIYKIPGYTQDNTVILDDYDEVYKTQKNNCIIAHPFEFTKADSPEDKFFSNLIPLLKNMKDTKAVESINSTMSKTEGKKK